MLSMFNNERRRRPTMPKDIREEPTELTTALMPDAVRRFAPPAVRETDDDAADNLISAHRRVKQERDEAKAAVNDALVELRLRAGIIQQREAEIAELRNRLEQERHRADQASKDCAALENLFQNIASITDSFLRPREIKRELDVGGTSRGGSPPSFVTETPADKQERLPDQERGRD